MMTLAPAAALAAALALSQTPPTLTLEDAVRRSADANLDLKAARARLDQAHAGVWKAWSYYLPQVTAGATYTHNDVGVSLPFPVYSQVRNRTGPQDGTNPNNPVDPPAFAGALHGTASTTEFLSTVSTDITIQKQDQVGGQVQVNQALFAPSLWFAIQAAYRSEELATKTVEATRQEVLFGTAQAYYAVTSLKKLLDVSERLLETAQRQEKDADVRYRAGTIAKVGLLRAQIDRTGAEQDLRRARNAYESARLSLALLLDRDPNFEVVEPPAPALPPSGEDLEAAALRARPDVEAARRGEAVVAALRRSTMAQYLPNVGAFGRWQIANVGGFTGNDTSWAVGLGLTWNIFDGGLREASLREGSARIAEAEASRQAAERRAVTEVRQALLDLESAQANAKKAQEQADLAAENQRLVDVSYRAGAATAVEQADATATYRNAAIAATTESLSAQLAALRVLKAAGAYDPVLRGR